MDTLPPVPPRKNKGTYTNAKGEVKKHRHRYFTDAEREAMWQGLHNLLSCFHSKNHMSRKLEISRNSVTRWFSEGFIGGQSVQRAHEVTGVSKHGLRPDLYDKSEKRKTKEVKQ